MVIILFFFLIRKHCSTVTADLMNNVLGNVLKLIGNNIGAKHAPWMTRIASKFYSTTWKRNNYLIYRSTFSDGCLLFL